MFACGGPVGLRPSRPATIGRVDGFTSHLNRPPSECSVLSSESGNSCAAPISVPMLFFHTGEVELMKLLWIFRFHPLGALPVISEWSAELAVDASIS